MSRIVEANPVTVSPVENSSTGNRAKATRGLLIWTIVGCTALASSGVVRGLQDRRFEVEKGYLEDCPFPLKDLPKKFEGWRIAEGGDKTLDPLTTRITGATDHFIRTYVDEMTGVTLSVLVLFGPAEPVLPHTPQICYPSCGFAPTEEASDRLVKSADGESYLFRTSVYAKSGGRATLREVVYHSFRLEGPWSPDVAAGRKFPRKNPGIFKVQVQRRMAEGEVHGPNDPIKNFLALLIPEIDRRVMEAQLAKSGSSAIPSAVETKTSTTDASPAAATR